MAYSKVSSKLARKFESCIHKIRRFSDRHQEQLLDRLSPARRILFSHRPDWEPLIRQGFDQTPHHIEFQKLTPENVTGYDLVVPLTLDDVHFMDQHRRVFTDNPLPIPSATSIEICDDKVLFHQTLTEKGYGRYLPPLQGELGYPYILKKKIDEWGQSCVVIHNPKQEADHLGLLKDPDYFRQRMVVGPDEYATHMIVRKGKLVRSLNIEYTFDTDTPIKGPDKPIRKRIAKCPHLKLFTRILNDLRYEGLCCFNYKPGSDGEPLIFEINPRFGSSLSPHFHRFVRHIFS